ncbi:hypothetical protein [Halalkalicoccus salilacus]|uniref:hypothetical protein n=1 Tax=Halalkalicoccus sp. GCM10025704 TaxID=3252662 RepID=UPI0036218362
MNRDSPSLASRAIAAPCSETRSGSNVAADATGWGKSVVGSPSDAPGGPSAILIPGTSSRSTPWRILPVAGATPRRLSVSRRARPR